MGSSMRKHSSSHNCYQKSSKDVGKCFSQDYYHAQSQDSKTSFQGEKNQFTFSNTGVYDGPPARDRRRLSNFSSLASDTTGANGYNSNHRLSK